jgi:hypothetical protein
MSIFSSVFNRPLLPDACSLIIAAFTFVPPSGAEVHPDCIAAVKDVVKLCEDLGHHMEEARPDVNWDRIERAINVIFGAGMLSKVKEKTGQVIPGKKTGVPKAGL